MDWADYSEVWLPAKATLNKVHSAAVLPAALAGLWPDDDSPVKLSALCAWFDGAQAFDEIAQPGYPPEKRPIPKADYKLVHQAVAQAVARGEIWLVFGNDSVLGEKPTDLQLDPDASLLRPPTRLRAMDLLAGCSGRGLGRDPGEDDGRQALCGTQGPEGAGRGRRASSLTCSTRRSIRACWCARLAAQSSRP